MLSMLCPKWTKSSKGPDLLQNRRAAEQGAGADRLQRGGTWPIFILSVLLLLVLCSVAAAQLERWAELLASLGCSACVTWDNVHLLSNVVGPWRYAVAHDVHTFAYAEESIEQFKQRLVAVLFAALLIQPIMLVALGIPLDFGRKTLMLIGLLLLTLVVIVAIGYFQMKYMFRHFRELRLRITDDGLERQSGKATETVPWTAIRKVRKRQNPHSKLLAIEVVSTSLHPLTLVGFEDLDDIGHLIEARVPSHTYIETKRTMIAWEQPGIVFGLIVVLGLIAALMFRVGDRASVEYFIIASQFALVGMFLFYRPLSRQNPSFRKGEVIIAIVILVGNLLRLISMVFA